MRSGPIGGAESTRAQRPGPAGPNVAGFTPMTSWAEPTAAGPDGVYPPSAADRTTWIQSAIRTSQLAK